MTNISRRSALKLLGATAVTTGVGAGASTTVAAQSQESEDGGPVLGEIFKLGHTLGSNPPGGYAEEDVRGDGLYALLGSFLGEGGTFLFDIRNPTNPTQVHRLRSTSAVRNADAEFGTREGLYYRSQEPNSEDASFHGVEVVDYGYERGSVESPIIVGEIDSGPTHNLSPHPSDDVDILYTTNEERTMQAWDVSDPSSPSKLFEGPDGGDAHDFRIDPEEEVMYLAGHVPAGDDSYYTYAFFDVSDPASPRMLGGLDPTNYPSLEDAGLDEPGFNYEFGHYLDYDPDRQIAYSGDETGRGVPGGKWAIDVGWDEGSFENPIPLGFTRSPNAELQDEVGELFDWTTHNHDIISKSEATLMVSGDYHEGTVVYDFTDPRNPAPSDQYMTDDMAEEAESGAPMLFPEGDSPPMAWGANYNEERDLVVTSDMWTGLYVFTVTPTPNTGDDDDSGGHHDD